MNAPDSSPSFSAQGVSLGAEIVRKLHCKESGEGVRQTGVWGARMGHDASSTQRNRRRQRSNSTKSRNLDIDSNRTCTRHGSRRSVSVGDARGPAREMASGTMHTQTKGTSKRKSRRAGKQASWRAKPSTLNPRAGGQESRSAGAGDLASWQAGKPAICHPWRSATSPLSLPLPLSHLLSMAQRHQPSDS